MPVLALFAVMPVALNSAGVFGGHIPALLGAPPCCRHAMPVSLHEYSSKAENRESSQNKANQGQKSNEEKHKDNIRYLSTLPISAGKSARSRSSLDHAEILKGGFGLCQKQKQNRNGSGCRYSSMPTSRQSKDMQIDF